MFEYAEGNLTPEQVEKLRLFVLLHPELDLELDAWKEAKVHATPIDYPNTALLVRKPSVSGHWQALIATAAAILLIFLIPVQFDAKKSAVITAASNNAEGAKGSGSGPEKQDNEDYSDRLTELEEENRALRAQIDRLMSDESNQQFADNFGADNTVSSDLGMNSTRGDAESLVVSDDNATTFDDQDAVSTLPFRELTLLTELGAEQHDENSSVSSARSVSNSGSVNRSFNSKLRSMARSIQRMMDNPIALKNSRDPIFALPGMMPQDINFSSAGTLLTTRVQTLSRMQWYGSDQEQFVNKVSVDGYSYGMRGGIGLQLVHSSFHNGGIQHGGLALTYSPKFSVNKFISVEPNIRFKMGAKVLDFDRVEQLDAVELESGIPHEFYPGQQQPVGRQLWYKDLGTGILVNTKWFYAGVNIDNVFQHRDNMYNSDLTDRRRMDTDLTMSLGTDWENTRENMRLSPYVVFRSHEDLNELYAGVNFQWNWFVIGGAVSSFGEPSANLGMKFRNFGIFYSGDYSESLITGNKMLSHQISLRINGNTGRFGKRLQNL
jgi:hypothetical protein